MISRNMSFCGTLLCALPGAQLVDPSRATLLGSPLGDDSGVSIAVSEKVDALRRLRERLQLLTAHDALVLLRNSFALLKLQCSLLPHTDFGGL